MKQEKAIFQKNDTQLSELSGSSLSTAAGKHCGREKFSGMCYISETPVQLDSLRSALTHMNVDEAQITVKQKSAAGARAKICVDVDPERQSALSQFVHLAFPSMRPLEQCPAR